MEYVASETAVPGKLILAVLAALPALAAAGDKISAPCPENVQATLSRDEERGFWRDVTLRLHGALPTTNPKLADKLELYLGRNCDAATPSGPATWRKYVLGYSAWFDPRDVKGDSRQLYSWNDHEGVLVEAKEDGRSIRLVVDVTVHPDHWVTGGHVQATIDLTRDGNALSGTFTGTFQRAADDPAGLAGKFDTKGKVTGTIRAGLWPGRIGCCPPLKANEHPRLLFRAGDLPRLRQRLATGEGKALLAILAEQAERREGTWHGWAYGVLHQVTGEAKWADKARTWVEAVTAGKIKTPRYGWFTTDGGYMRVGPSAAAVAAAYDMCFDAWPEEFRKAVARKIQDRVCPNMVLEHDKSQSDPQFTPRSNHYGLWQGGAGTAILAIKGDDGTDEPTCRRAHRIFLQRLKRGLEVGFGDHGWFYEGTYCGRFPTTGGLNAYIQALRAAEGMDFVTDCSEARWLTTKWIYECLRTGGKLFYHTRGMYAQFKWDGFHGDFAQGFGAMPDEHRSAVLWFYQHVIEPGGVKRFDMGEGDKDAMNAAFAFVNWPIGEPARDPASQLGHVLYDREANFFVFRSGWAGEDDVVVSMFGDGVVSGMGLTGKFPIGIPATGDVTHFVEGEARKTVSISAENKHGKAGTEGVFAVAADFTGLSGAPLLMVGAFVPEGAKPSAERPAAGGASGAEAKELAALLGEGRKPAKADTPPAAAAGRPSISTRQFQLSGWPIDLMTVQKGTAPDAKVVGAGPDQRLVVGKRAIAFDGKRFALGRIGP
jgi:hypothetical protein